jgi:glycosyltransferase involved in cell wall biosynthesis
MPALYAGASCLVLASLPTRGWEEQFGMVLVEAMSCGTPVVACSTGAIPEVLADCGGGTLVGPGDWIGLARALAEGPLAARSTGSAPADAARLERFSTTAAAERLATAYASLLS